MMALRNVQVWRLSRFYSTKKNGGVLITVVWIMIVLSLLAVGIARNSSVDASLVKHALRQTQSYYAAVAGVTYAMDLIQEDSLDPQTQAYDSLYECGINLHGKDLNQVMGQVSVSEQQVFDVRSITAQGQMVLGFQDEDGKLNLNALTASNYHLLAHVIEALGFTRNDAEIVASSVLDWQDPDDEPAPGSEGAESEYYRKTSSGILAKNRPFDDLSELQWLKGVRSDIYYKLKPYVTIYPSRAQRVTLNFNTASLPVIRAFFLYAVENIAGLEAGSVDAVVERIVDFRNGPDGLAMTEDDRLLDLSADVQKELGLSISQTALYQMVMQAYHVPVSQFFRVGVTGIERKSSVESQLEVVVQRSPLAVLAWHRKG